MGGFKQLFLLFPLIGVTAAVSGSRSRPEPILLQEGLSIWRKPGAIQNAAACATCHSPDGIELAAYNFDDADIMRRAVPHLGTEDATRLVGYIHALRSKLGYTKLLDPDLDRPLQPGGEVLPGKTPEERDLAFGQELERRLPLLFNGRIETLPQAEAAEQRLLAVSPQTLRVGIPLVRLSEDVAHGNDHSSIAQWLPEDPPTISGADRAGWYSEEDSYLANPSPEALLKLLKTHDGLINTNRQMGLSAISTFKFRALLVLQDRLRHNSTQSDEALTPEVSGYPNYNPIWQVGEFARQMMERTPVSLGMTRATQEKKLAGPSFSEQLHALRVGWFWAGWLSDQGLFRTSHDDKTRLGMWLSESLAKDGPYPIHDVYANARRQAVVSNDPASWGETEQRKRRIWDFAGLRSFNRYITGIPKDPEARQLYIRFAVNCFRMNLLLIERDIQESGVVWIKISSKANTGELIDFIQRYDPDDSAHAESLKLKLLSVIDHAVEKNLTPQPG